MDGPAHGNYDLKSMKETKKDPSYFLQWEFITLKVDDTLFRVPLCHLLKHFRDKFKSPSTDGSSEEVPVDVDGGITAAEFRNCLQIFLPSVTVNPEDFREISKEQWVSLLKVSTTWHCSKLRKLAIDRLSTPEDSFSPDPLDPLEYIILGRKHYVSNWIETGYSALVRQENLTDVEMEALGADVSSKGLRITLDYLRRRTYCALDDRVRNVFHAEVKSAAEMESLYHDEDYEP